MYIYFPNISKMVIVPKLEYRTKDDGTARVYVYLYDARDRCKDKITTDVFVRPETWTGSEVSRMSAQAMYVNNILKIIVSEIMNHWLANKHLGARELKAWYLDKPVAPVAAKKYNVPEYFEEYLALCREGKILHAKKKTQLTDGYLRALGTSKKQLEKYAPALRFEQVGEEFYNSWVTHMRDAGYKQNYIGKVVKYFQIVCRYGLGKVHDNPKFAPYWLEIEKPFKLKLTPVEIKRIEDLDLSEYPELVPEWERFQVAYNLLLRFGDSVALDEKNVVKRSGRPYLSAVTGKTKKEIFLPIRPRVYKILKRNGFRLTATNSASNAALKKIGMLARVNEDVSVTEMRRGKPVTKLYKKYQLMETHTTRRSAARNLYDSGMDPLIIMVLGGWKSLKQLLEYVDIDLDYAAGKAAAHPFFN